MAWFLTHGVIGVITVYVICEATSALTIMMNYRLWNYRLWLGILPRHSNLFVTFCIIDLKLGRRSNALFMFLTHKQLLSEFKRLLKTFLFCWDSAPCEFLFKCAVHKYTYLLIYLLTMYMLTYHYVWSENGTWSGHILNPVLWTAELWTKFLSRDALCALRGCYS